MKTDPAFWPTIVTVLPVLLLAFIVMARDVGEAVRRGRRGTKWDRIAAACAVTFWLIAGPIVEVYGLYVLAGLADPNSAPMMYLAVFSASIMIVLLVGPVAQSVWTGWERKAEPTTNDPENP